MIRKLSALALTLAALSGLTASGAQPAQLEKLYVLQVFDTNDEDLKLSLEKDEERMTLFWKNALPSRRLELITLKGKEAFPAAISQTIRGLRRKVTSNDAVVFFFGGHGALIERKGQKPFHVLRFRSGQDIERASLRKMLENCKAGLTVMLTDCCSTKEKYDGDPQKDVVARGKIPAVVNALFFKSRGVVDITAATEEEAWSDDINGGLFTRTLVKMLRAKPDEVGGTEKDGVTWEQFFPHLQKGTQTFFKDWSEKMKARYPNCPIRAETQKPHAFFLGKQTAYNAVELENQRGTPLKYKFRWKGEGDEDWKDMVIEPGKRFCHSRPLPGKSELVPLEILREGAAKENELKALLWDKDTAPRLDFRYVVRPKK